MQLIDDVLRKRYTELQQQGRSEAEIEKIFSDIDYGAAMIELIETMSSDHVDLFEKQCMRECYRNECTLTNLYPGMSRFGEKVLSRQRQCT